MRASTLLSWVALWALGFVRASVRVRTEGCGSGSSLTRYMVGGVILDYSSEVATSTADLTTFKILINNTLSTKDVDMMMMDITHIMWVSLHPYMNT
jgi:hypothetical protein